MHKATDNPKIRTILFWLVIPPTKLLNSCTATEILLKDNALHWFF